MKLLRSLFGNRRRSGTLSDVLGPGRRGGRDSLSGGRFNDWRLWCSLNLMGVISCYTKCLTAVRGCSSRMAKVECTRTYASGRLEG